MFFIRIVLMALRSLKIHPLRSLLAMLGVIIGVGAVVAAMAILEGMGAQMASSFASMGSKRLFVSPSINRRAGRMVGNFDAIKLEDATAIGKECDALKLVMPQVQSSGNVKFLSKSTTASILGGTEIYPDINNHKLVEGQFITRSDVQGAALVAVLGHKVKEELFGGRPAIDEKIKISNPLGVTR